MAAIFFSSCFFPPKTSHSLSKPKEPVAFFSFYLKQYFFSKYTRCIRSLRTFNSGCDTFENINFVNYSWDLAHQFTTKQKAIGLLTSYLLISGNKFRIDFIVSLIIIHMYLPYFFSFISSRKFIYCCLVSKNIEIIINSFFVKYLVLNPIRHSN